MSDVVGLLFSFVPSRTTAHFSFLIVECLTPARNTQFYVFKVAAPSRHLPGYDIYLRNYVTKNVIRPTVHLKFLIPHVTPY
jgi:hypothetical protein